MVLAIQDCHNRSLDRGWLNRKRVKMKISDYLDPRCILFLKATERDEALKELVDILFHCGKIEDKEALFQAVCKREELVSTGIGMGVAIPHAKLNQFDDFFIAIGILKTHKINWNSIDKLPVRLIFMIGGPEIKRNEYLQLLSKLTMAITDDNLRRNILKTTKKEEIIKLFHQI